MTEVEAQRLAYLLEELEWQVRLSEREACAEVADEHMREHEGKSFGVGNAIRARGK